MRGCREQLYSSERMESRAYACAFSVECTLSRIPSDPIVQVGPTSRSSTPRRTLTISHNLSFIALLCRRAVPRCLLPQHAALSRHIAHVASYSGIYSVCVCVCVTYFSINPDIIFHDMMYLINILSNLSKIFFIYQIFF